MGKQKFSSNLRFPDVEHKRSLREKGLERKESESSLGPSQLYKTASAKKRCRSCMRKLASIRPSSFHEDDVSDSCSYKTCPSDDPKPSMQDILVALQQIESRVFDLVHIVKKIEANSFGSFTRIEEQKNAEGKSGSDEEVRNNLMSQIQNEKQKEAATKMIKKKSTAQVSPNRSMVRSPPWHRSERTTDESYSASNRDELDSVSASSSMSRSYSTSYVSSSTTSKSSNGRKENWRSMRRIRKVGSYTTQKKLRKMKSHVGVFRQLKNKIGFIFHHHHHHHHHGGDAKKGALVKKESMWRLAKKIFPNNDKGTAKKAGRTKTVVVRKSQKGHFHALVEGLMSHVKRTKRVKRRRRAPGNLGMKGFKMGFMRNKKCGLRNIKKLKY